MRLEQRTMSPNSKTTALDVKTDSTSLETDKLMLPDREHPVLEKGDQVACVATWWDLIKSPWQVLLYAGPGYEVWRSANKPGMNQRGLKFN